MSLLPHLLFTHAQRDGTTFPELLQNHFTRVCATRIYVCP